MHFLPWARWKASTGGWFLVCVLLRPVCQGAVVIPSVSVLSSGSRSCFALAGAQKAFVGGTLSLSFFPSLVAPCSVRPWRWVVIATCVCLRGRDGTLSNDTARRGQALRRLSDLRLYNQ